MLLTTVVCISSILHAGLVHGTPYQSEKSVVHLRNYNRLWGGEFIVGASNDTWLVIDTVRANTVLMEDYVEPSALADTSLSNYTSPVQVQIMDFQGANRLITLVSSVHLDKVQVGSLVAKKQLIWTSHDRNQRTHVLGFGRLGWNLPNVTAAHLHAPYWPFLRQACKPGVNNDCRFGLSLGTKAAGKLVLGGVEKTEFEGDLKYFDSMNQWTLPGQVVLASEPQSSSDTLCVFSSMTPKILGSFDAVESLFNASGIESVRDPSTNELTGYYACDKQPVIGFKFSDSIFNVDSEALEYLRLDDNKCMIGIEGVDDEKLHQLSAGMLSAASPGWILGQPFFEGHYIDFVFAKNWDNATVGIGIARQTDAARHMPLKDVSFLQGSD